MRIAICAAVFALFAAAGAPALAAPLPADLAAAAKAWDAAQLTGDRAALERLLADDYRLVNGGGRVESKAQFIKDLTDPEVKEDPFVIEQPIEQLWANGAVLGGVTNLTGTDHGTRFHARIRFADVWARRDGRWQLIYTQVSPLKAP
jgi:hypothetical protein